MDPRNLYRKRVVQVAASMLYASVAFGPAYAQDTASDGTKPNILVIWGDDIGQTNISAYSFGLMGYRTPNIDSIAQEGIMFTDYYAEQSCTAGRSTFITGQSTLRTGLSKVGLPGADIGLREDDVTMAAAFKDLGYATGQFGKNHLGDKDEFLPTAHGFDEFFGNLYHLNAEEEPENFNYPTDPAFREQFGPRGVIRSSADGEIEDTGPLTKKRMETVDEETSAAAIDFMQRQVEQGKPFFVWMNTTRMHFRTHVKEENRSEPGLTALTEYADGMIEHDKIVGQILDAVDEMGVADNTIVMYSTDNGPHQNSWPDAATTPFRSEKNTNWEGAFRVPAMIKWPGKFEPGTVKNGLFSGLDWFPTLLAAAGDTDIKDRLLEGTTINGKEYNVHLDGYNQLPYLTGEADDTARKEFFYFNDDGLIVGLRYENWKIVFQEQRVEGTLEIWANPFTPLRVPKIFDLRADPYERADRTSNTYYDWLMDRVFLLTPAQVEVSKFFETFKEFPPSQRAASFSVDQIQEQLEQQLNGVTQ
ncbi:MULTISPECIES: arylsulfatase [Halocynthiibacter]|uniref:Arylsulfatase n=1 Tax=Halocynthiibacter halioticoli TaxID=2986804 RepID=A0AAE3J385_9RHOB|nr:MULTISPECIES: arylsulfatase [Halocynthiibacter]MCV6824522.1 arylsulfatase [Halocynthiibacter halioticoli]MCW4057523.1 arylsulfatase [Halocynthiibacter sp. SDUM655004]